MVPGEIEIYMGGKIPRLIGSGKQVIFDQNDIGQGPGDYKYHNSS